MEQLNSPHIVDNASNNGSESITKHKLFEKYLFFDQSDVNTYFYKKRTLSPLEFLSYKRNLDNMAKIINPSLSKIDEEFKGKYKLDRDFNPVQSFQSGFSKSYSKKNRFWDIEPQASLIFDEVIYDNFVGEYSQSPEDFEYLTDRQEIFDNLLVNSKINVDHFQVLESCVDDIDRVFGNYSEILPRDPNFVCTIDSERELYSLVDYDIVPQSLDPFASISEVDKLLELEDEIFLKNEESYSKSWDDEDSLPEEEVEPQSFFSAFTDPLGLKKLSEHLPDVLDTIGDKLPDTEERQKLLNTLNNFEKKVPSFMSGVSSETLQSTTDILSGIGTMSPTILVAITSAWYAHSRTWPSYAMFIGSAIYFVIKSPDQLTFLLKLYMNLSDKIPECPDLDMDAIEPQFSDSTLELVGSIIASALIGVVGAGSKASAAALTLTFVKDFSRAKLGMVEIAKLVVKFVESLVNFFRETFLDLPSVRFLDSCSREIDMFTDEVRVFSFKFNRGSLPTTEETYSNIVCLLEVGKHLLKTIPKDKYTDASLRMIHDDSKSLQRILTELERQDVTLKGMRQEPAAVLFSGGPGTAKSLAAAYLCHTVAPDGLSPEERAEFDSNPGPFIYSRKQEMVFFDGLTNRARVFFYDDLLQARDVAGSPACEAMELIRIINSEEYSAHMAHLENKGNVYIRPKYVIATTNQPDLTSNAIVSNKALKRRFALSYVVIPKPDYTMDCDLGNDLWNRRIDYTKLPTSNLEGLDYPKLKGLEVSDLRPEHLEYHQYDLLAGKYTGEVHTFDEVVTLARKVEFVKRKQFALHKENLRNMIKKYSRIYEIEVEDFKLPDDYSYDPDAEDSDEEEQPFIDSLLLTDNMRREIELLLCQDPKYAHYLFNLVSKDKFFHHSNDMIEVLVDAIGYHQLIADIICSKKYQITAFDHVNTKKRLHVRVFESVKKYVDKFLNLLPSWRSVSKFLFVNYDLIISVLSFIAASSFLTFAARWLYTWWTGKPAPQSFGHSQKLRTPKTKTPYFKSAQAMKASLIVNAQLGVEPQFGDDSSGVDLIDSIVRRNCFKFESLNDDGQWNTMGSITFIDGRIGVMPYHFILKLFAGVQSDPKRLKRAIRLSHGKNSVETDLLFTVEEIIVGHQTGCLANKDLVLVEFPKRFPERRRIVKFFGRRKQLEYNTTNLEIVLANISRDRGFYFGRGARFPDILAISEKHVGVPYTIDESFTYDIPTKSGDCGSLMGILNSSQDEKIFGIHVAGHTHYGDGFSAIVTQEELLEDLKLFDDQLISEEPDFIEPQSSDFDKPLRFEIMGRTKLVPSRNTSTDIRKSRMFGLLGDNGLYPAMLRPFLMDGTLIDPLLNAQMKYCQPDILIDYDLVRECCKNYFSFIDWTEVHDVDRRVYTNEEAIYGLDYDVDFGSISSSTSAGWPMNVQGCRNYKKELFSYAFGTYEQGILFDEVCALVDNIISKAYNNIRMFHVFTDNLKDELREKEKVLAGSTRLFSGCEFTYLIAFRRYFGAFALWYMKNRISNGSAIGVNPYSSEWNSIAKRLIAISASNILAGDYSKYDGSQKPLIHLLILDEINRWYNDGEDNCRIRSILWMEVYNSRHIVDGVIYEWLSGLPSGHPFTIIINTIYNHIVSRYVWFRSVGNHSSYNDNTYTVAQGDDITAAVTDEFKDKFSDVIFAKYALELGLTYTNETKSGELIPHRGLSEIEFLKRSFVFDERENLFIAPLKLKSILKMVDWTKRKNKNRIVADNVITATKELSLHDKSTFDFYASEIRTEFKGHYPFLNTSEPLDVEFEKRREQVLGTIGFF